MTSICVGQSRTVLRRRRFRPCLWITHTPIYQELFISSPDFSMVRERTSVGPSYVLRTFTVSSRTTTTTKEHAA